MSWFNFKKNNENRDTQVTAPSISLDEKNVDAISLIFGKYRADNLARNLSSVFRAVSLISNSLASLPIYTMKYDSNQDTMVKAKTHSLYRLLLKSPNGIMDSFTFIKALTTDMLLRGNGYAHIERDFGTGKVVGLTYVPANKVNITKKYDIDNNVNEVLYNVSGARRMYQAYEMIHIKNELDEDGVEGVSTLTFANRTLKLANANEQSAMNMFESGGAISGIIKTTGALTDKQRREMSAVWKQTFGSGNSNGVAILSGTQDFQSVSLNAEEQQLLETRKFEVEEIARFFNVSPILLFGSTGNYSSATAAKLSLLTDTLAPIINKFETEFENKLFTAPEQDRMEIRFDVENFIRGDNEATAKYYRELWNFGVLSIAEIRAKLGLGKVDEAEVQGANEHYIAAQMCSLKYATNLGSANDKNLDKTLKPADPSSNVDSSVDDDEEKNTEEETKEADKVQQDASTGDTENNTTEE